LSTIYPTDRPAFEATDYPNIQSAKPTAIAAAKQSAFMSSIDASDDAADEAADEAAINAAHVSPESTTNPTAVETTVFATIISADTSTLVRPQQSTIWVSHGSTIDPTNEAAFQAACEYANVSAVSAA
jgi:hypothetical protein